MEFTSPQSLSQALNWRYAVKKFDPVRKIPHDVWQALESSLILTPSSYGLQPWRFLIVQDPLLRKQLTPLSWNQTQIEDCSHLVVLCRRQDMTEADIQALIDRMVLVRGTDPAKLEGYKKSMINDVVKGPRHLWVKEWAARQVYIALGNFMTSAAMVGVDTCPIEGLEPAGYDRVLQLEGTGYETIAACPAGYRSPQDAYQHNLKVRFEGAQVVKYL